MRKFLTAMFTMCLAVPCVFAFTGCSKNNDTDVNYASQVAGTYSNECYEGESVCAKVTSSVKLQKDGKFTFTQVSDYGSTLNSASLTGSLFINKDNSVKSVTVDNLDDLMQGGSYVFMGHPIPVNEIETTGTEEITTEMFKAVLEKMLKASISFTDSYMMFSFVSSMPDFTGSADATDSGSAGSFDIDMTDDEESQEVSGTTEESSEATSEIQILYKEGATRLEEGTVARVMTAKELFELTNAMSFSNVFPTYATDYYFEKGKTVDKTNLGVGFYIVDANGNAQFDKDFEIKSVEGVDTSKLGTGTFTIKYMNGTKEESKTVTYTVVATEDDLPENQVRSCTVGKVNGTEVVTQTLVSVKKGDDELYEAGLSYVYTTYGDNEKDAIAIVKESCEGDDAVLTIKGYDANKTGYQVISIAYLGKAYEQAIYVYDETDNPVVSATLSAYATVTIDKTKAEPTITVSASVTPNKIDGSQGTAVTLTKNDAVNLKADLSKYKDGDTIVFKCVIKNVTYYFAIQVKVVESVTA